MRIAAAALAVGVLTGCASARADQMEYVVEIVCVPQAGYFSLQERMVDDVDIEAINRGARSQTAALVWPESLMQPFSCALGAHTIEASVVSVTAKKTSSGCGTRAGWNVRIAWDGRTIDCINSNDSPYPEQRQSMMLTLNGTQPRQKDGNALMEHCAVAFRPVNRNTLSSKLEDEGILRCRTQFFDPATGEDATHRTLRGRRT